VVRHLYVHIPFCVRRCSYCDFSIAVRKRVPGSEYVHAVLRELELLRDSPTWEATDLETVYLGGGTPSLLASEAIQMLLHGLVDPGLAARGQHTQSGTREVTLEANPEDVTPANATTWRSAGVNRVSLGAQSFDDRVLQWMHRSHDAARIGEAVRTLRAGGIENVSLDLIFALPDELQRDWGRDLDQAIALLPAHISLYGLTVEPRTPLDRWISRGATKLPADERYAEEYLRAHEKLSVAGYQFYEVSNAARDNLRSRHNSAYWSGHPYLGLGPAAHSFDGRSRRWNIRAWDAYARAIAAGRSPIESEEVLTEEQRRLERVYLALRTDAGLPLTDYPANRLTALLEAGWVVEEGDRLRCTPEGWLRLDALVAKLFPTKGLSPS
jgi:oxygen-independent coproporphyrinogen-3 oxidase